MLSPDHVKDSPVNLATRFVPVAAIAASFVLVGCGNANAEADISESGRLAYACSLAEHIEAEHGDPASWDVYIGNEADPGARETAAIGALTTGSDNTDLVAAGEDLIEAITRLDIDLLNSGLEAVKNTCDTLDVGPSVDVSHEAQLDYACALANGVADKHGSAGAWIDQSEPDVRYELASAASLTGAFNGQKLAQHQQLSQAGMELLRAVQVQDADGIDANLETFLSECMEL